MAQQDAPVWRDDTPGATKYNIRFSTGDMIALYVLQRGNNITTVQMHPIVPRGAPPVLQPETRAHINALIGDCISEATTAIRYEHPEFTLRPIEGITPPLPRYDDEGWKNVFEWHAIYARAMPDDELAKLQKVSLQTVYNARSKYGAKKRIPREENTRSKPKPKVSKKT